MHVSERLHITEAVTKYCKNVVADEHRLNKFDNVDAIDETFYEFPVVRKCQIIQVYRDVLDTDE